MNNPPRRLALPMIVALLARSHRLTGPISGHRTNRASDRDSNRGRSATPPVSGCPQERPPFPGS
ncbi:MAG: hypothetical protein LC804_19815 [Acidobacteria bacterium]|nr:hypothetical protein [Acidobacteriota bacterium]